jgi:hypothetical protein
MGRNDKTLIRNFDYLLELLDPYFIERDGRVYFKGHFNEKNYEKYWKPMLEVDTIKTERTLNHIHLSEITTDLKLQKRVGERIKRVWKRVIQRSFPEKAIYLSLNKSGQKGRKEWVLDLWSKPTSHSSSISRKASMIKKQV